MHHLALFFIGAFLCNSIPHLSAGLQGRSFPTLFARPAGIGFSPPVVNVLWGMINLVAGLFLLAANPVTIGINTDFAVVLVGALVLGAGASLHFAKVHADRKRD
jgi:hypothetical protein